MSGTSVDAVDCALLACADGHVDLLATHEHEIPAPIRGKIDAISHSGPNEIERMGVLDRELGLLFGEAALQLLATSHTDAGTIAAIGSHGQTIRHRPASITATADSSFTLQIGDANTIAEYTGITTVADFRRRDVAAGGEGAPLAPAFHAATLAREGVNRAIVNIGGIANISLLRGHKLEQGFDTGPGNTLLDNWTMRHLGQAFDGGGQWAASGQCAPVLLEQLLSTPYFSKTGPRSTGKELFNLNWLDEQLSGFPDLAPVDVQATLAEFTVSSITRAITSSPLTVDEIYICGGGAHNKHLMKGLQEQTNQSTVDTTQAIGLDPDWVEAAAFAWLACQTLQGLPGNAPAVTGAAGPRVLGAIYPGTV